MQSLEEFRTAAPGDGPARVFQRAGSLFAIALIALGALVVCAWTFGIERLEDGGRWFGAVKGNGALLFIVLGFALLLARSPRPQFQRIARLAAACVMVFSAITLLQYVTGRNFGVDELFFRDFWSTSFPGRMAPATAISFILIAGALSVDLHGTQLKSRIAIVLVAAIAFVGLSGYIFGVTELYRIGKYTAMALLTAVGLLMASVAYICIQWSGWVTTILSNKLAGGQIARQLLLATFFVPLVLGRLLLQGELAGYYDVRFGFALTVALTGISLSALTLVAASMLNRSAEKTQEAVRRLIASQARYRELVEHAPQAVAMFDKEMRYMEASSRWLRDYNLNSSILGKSHYEIFPNIPERWKDVYRRALSGTIEHHPADDFIRDDGRHHWLSWQVRPWRDIDGSIGGILIYSDDITGQKEAEAKSARLFGDLQELSRTLEKRVAERTQQLAIARDKFEGIISIAADAIIAINESGKITLFNGGAEKIFGYTSDEIIGQSLDILIPDCAREAHRRHVAAFGREIGGARRMGDRSEVSGKRKNGEVFAAEAAIAKQKTEDGMTYTAILRDISDRQRAEKQQERLYEERAMLLREIHHRVKNNLQILSSLFYLQSCQAKDESVRQIFDDSRGRIQSIALIHQNLYRSEHLSAIELSNYLRDLAQNISSTAGPLSPRIVVEASNIVVDLEHAIPCALIINELLSNAIKHAFPNNCGGDVRVSASTESGIITLTVRDSGVGLPANFEMVNSKTLGLQLVAGLAKQLQGSITFERGPGATFRVQFPNVRSSIPPAELPNGGTGSS